MPARKTCVRRAKVVPIASPAPELKVDEKPLRPAQCRAHLRKKLADEFHNVVKGFVAGVASGSCQHVKLAMEILDERPRRSEGRRGRSSLELWAEQLEEMKKADAHKG